MNVPFGLMILMDPDDYIFYTGCQQKSDDLLYKLLPYYPRLYMNWWFSIILGEHYYVSTPS
jgi:hypothetical protein